jgi:hypothetical protein
VKGKRLSIDDLERLPIGTKVSVNQGLYYYDYIVSRDSDNRLCLRDDYLLVKLFYQDILKMDVYEHTRKGDTSLGIDYHNSIQYIASKTQNTINYFDQINFCNGSSIQSLKSHKPEIRIEREFNIAKKKEFEMPKLTRDQRLKYIIAHVEINIDRALESGNKDRFIMLTNKLKEFRQAFEVI